MADKQILINGVDVSGCIYLKKNNKMYMCRACNSGVGSPYCEYHKDCYYKNCKRKDQELQEAMDNYVQLDLQRVKEYNELVDLYEAKEQECEKLKEQVEVFTRQLEKANKEVIKENKKNATQRQKNEKLEQTLTEIKEIAKKSMREGKMLSGGWLYQKIREVEND